MAEFIKARKPDGELVEVSRKVFERVLKERGYTLESEKSVKREPKTSKQK